METTEAGAHSKADKKALQQIHDHAAELGAECTPDGDESARWTPWLKEALKQSDSMSAKLEKVHAAVRKGYENSRHYAYPRDVFDSHVVVQHGNKMFQHKYTEDSNGSITLGDPTEVEATYTPISAKSAESGHDAELQGDVIPLSEAAAASAGTVPIKVINPGWGSSGYYSKEVLERDGPKCFPAGTKMYLDHPTKAEENARPERSVKDLAAVTTSAAKWDDKGKDGPGLYAEAEPLPSHREFLNGAAKHIGVSIRAAGISKAGEAEGKKGPIIERLVVGRSIDFVTQAGRGGKILTESGREASSLRDLYEAGCSSKDGRPGEHERMEPTKELLEAQAENKRLKEALLLRESAGFVAETLKGHKNLADLTRDRLQEALALKPVTKDGAIDKPAFKIAIDEAVKAEVEYLAKLTGSGKVRGMGGDGSKVETSEAANDDAAIVKQLEESFRAQGMSEAAAKVAAKGRR